MITNLNAIIFSVMVASAFFIGGSMINDMIIFTLGFMPTGYMILCAIEYLRWNPYEYKISKKKSCISCGNKTTLRDDHDQPECLDCYKKEVNRI